MCFGPFGVLKSSGLQGFIINVGSTVSVWGLGFCYHKGCAGFCRVLDGRLVKQGMIRS